MSEMEIVGLIDALFLPGWIATGLLAAFFTVRGYIREELRYHAGVTVGSIPIIFIIIAAAAALGPMALAAVAVFYLADAKLWKKTIYRRPHYGD